MQQTGFPLVQDGAHIPELEELEDEEPEEDELLDDEEELEELLLEDEDEEPDEDEEELEELLLEDEDDEPEEVAPHRGVAIAPEVFGEQVASPLHEIPPGIQQIELPLL